MPARAKAEWFKPPGIRATGDGARRGSWVEVRWDGGAVETLLLCETMEFSSGPDWVSPDSELGHALVGRRPGDTIALLRPKGVRRGQILAVR